MELALALAITGVLLGIALPRLATLADGLAVDAAAREIVAAHGRARITAILRTRVVELTIGPNDLAIRPRGDAADLWHSPGPAAHRVVLASAPKIITFSPVGITTGLSNASFRLTRGGASRTVVVSRLGRVRITRP
jgi:Tfp pilus assembly protein FimT